VAELFVRIFISGFASDYGNDNGNDFIGVTQTLSDRTDEGKGMLGCGLFVVAIKRRLKAGKDYSLG
jgi:hypothetical protein